MKTIKYLLLSAILISFMSCNDEVDVIPEDEQDAEVVLPELTSGSLDLSNYVSVGASFTAGITDLGLFIAGQENSFPNLLAQQFANAGGGDFIQPLANDNIGGFLYNGNPLLPPRLYFDGSGPAILPATPTTDVANVITGPFNNMGVPGAKSFHLLVPGFGNVAAVPLGLANPFYARMASSPNATVMQDALAQNPSFFTLSEIGGNDVLSFVLSGGTGVDQTGNFDPSTYGPDDVTDPTVFAQTFNSMVSALTQNGAKGVVVTVPNINSLPVLTTVPHNPIPLDQTTAGLVNGAYAQYNAGLIAAENFGAISAEEREARTITFSASNSNAVVMEDEYLTDLSGFGLPSIRQATSNDLVLLAAGAFIGTEAVPGNPLTVNGVAVPLGDQWILSPQEQQIVVDATSAYNDAIVAAASSNPDVALADLRTVLDQASTVGYPYDDYLLTSELVFGGLVSLDGVHLTSRGYGLMAKEILTAMDDAFGSNFIASGNVPVAGDLPTNYPATLQ